MMYLVSHSHVLHYMNNTYPFGMYIHIRSSLAGSPDSPSFTLSTLHMTFDHMSHK